MKKIFGTDIDIPSGENEQEVLGKLKELSKCFDTATELKLIVVGKLNAKDAFRIRLKGIYEPV